MTRIHVSGVTNPNTDWIQRNRDEVKKHPAWHEDISEEEATKLLENQPLFTYILRPGEKERAYFISFVQEDLSVKHQFFVLEIDRRGWRYLNGTTNNCPSEIVSQNLHELIPLMMHCDPKTCISILSQE